MHSFFLRLPFTRIEIWAEVQPTQRRHPFFDWDRDGQDFYLWAGRLHVQLSLPRVVAAKGF